MRCQFIQLVSGNSEAVRCAKRWAQNTPARIPPLFRICFALCLCAAHLFPPCLHYCFAGPHASKGCLYARTCIFPLFAPRGAVAPNLRACAAAVPFANYALPIKCFFVIRIKLRSLCLG